MLDAIDSWYAVACYPNTEREVANILRARDYEVLLAHYHADVVHKRKIVTHKRLVITGYVFVRLDLEKDDWKLIYRVPGVEWIISCPNRHGDLIPIPIPEEHMRLPAGAKRIFDYVEIVEWSLKNNLIDRVSEPKPSRREIKRLKDLARSQAA